MIDQKKVDAIDSLVVGWMEPVLKRTDPISGEVLNGLGPRDFRRVMAGYGCPRCLAKYRSYLVVCPACEYTRNIEEDVQAPPELWTDWVAEMAQEELQGGKPLSADEFIKSVMADRDIDHIKL